MAAFEALGKLMHQPFDRESTLDVRVAELPPSSRKLPDTPDDFDPRNYREPKNPIKLWMAYFNLFRTGFGPGILAVPLAISQGGMILGPILALCTWCLVIHSHLKLLRCLNEICRQLKIPHISYRYGFRMALLHGPPFMRVIGKRGPSIIATFMILSQLGICTVFVNFSAGSLRDIMDWRSNQPALLTLLLPYLVIEFGIWTLKSMSYISMLGNLLNLAGMCVVIYHIFEDPRGEVVLYKTDFLPLLLAFGTLLFNSSAVAVVLSLDQALVDPKPMTKCLGVITIGMFVPCVVSTVFGSLCYWSFVTIEDNVLRYLPYDTDSAMAALGIYMISIALAFPLQSYPGIQVLVEVLKNRRLDSAPSEKTLKMVQIIGRPVFVLTCFFFSFLAPYQGALVAFVGNMCSTPLVLIFPALMEICLMYPHQYGKYKIYLVKNLFIVTVGLISWIFGCYFCMHLIYIRLFARFSNDRPYTY